MTHNIIQTMSVRSWNAFYEELNINDIDITGTIALSRLTVMALNESISKYVKNFSKNRINFISISQYRNFVGDYKSGARLEHLPIILSEFDLDPDF